MRSNGFVYSLNRHVDSVNPPHPRKLQHYRNKKPCYPPPSELAQYQTNRRLVAWPEY